MGDVLLTTPFVRSLKNLYPEMIIDFCLREQYADVYKHNPFISKILLYEETSDFFHSLSFEKYDFVIDLQHNHRSGVLVNKLKVPYLKFYKRSVDKFLLVNFKINNLKNAPPIPERYAKIINLNLDGKGPDIYIPDDIKLNAPKKENCIALCPGSRHYTKMWLENYFAELGNKLIAENFNVVLLGGRDDRDKCRRLSKEIPGSEDLSNNNNLLLSAAILEKCIAAVCNDSGLMHTACAVKTPVCTIMGSSVKELGFYPYQSKSIVLENNSLRCRPCSHIGRSSCPLFHFKCMKEIKPELVFKKLMSLVMQYD